MAFMLRKLIMSKYEIGFTGQLRKPIRKWFVHKPVDRQFLTQRTTESSETCEGLNLKLVEGWYL